jgi:hypothetical protein
LFETFQKIVCDQGVKRTDFAGGECVSSKILCKKNERRRPGFDNLEEFIRAGMSGIRSCGLHEVKRVGRGRRKKEKGKDWI